MFSLAQISPQVWHSASLGFPLQTHLPTGQQNHQATDGRSTLSPLPRQESQGKAWVKTQIGAGRWVLTLAQLKGIRQGFVKAPLSPSFMAGGCPSMATAPSASAEGVTAATFPFWGRIKPK